MREIIFCQSCKKKFHYDSSYRYEGKNYHDGTSDNYSSWHYFYHCQDCGATICDDCEKNHNCIDRLKGYIWNEQTVPPTFGDGHNCMKEEKEFNPTEYYCSCGKLLNIKEVYSTYNGRRVRFEPCNCKNDPRTEKQVEAITEYIISSHTNWIFERHGIAVKVADDSKRIIGEDIRKILRGD